MASAVCCLLTSFIRHMQSSLLRSKPKSALPHDPRVLGHQCRNQRQQSILHHLAWKLHPNTRGRSLLDPLDILHRLPQRMLCGLIATGLRSR